MPWGSGSIGTGAEIGREARDHGTRLNLPACTRTRTVSGGTACPGVRQRRGIPDAASPRPFRTQLGRLDRPFPDHGATPVSRLADYAGSRPPVTRYA
jgi:hypothetical protein